MNRSYSPITKHQPASVSALEAGLRYVTDAEPGITRHLQANTFYYQLPNGRKVKDNRSLKRIYSLVIPPGWTDVWICPLSNGHIQATGRDTRRRKQYRYHPQWNSVRDAQKYERIIAFAKMLPKIRHRVATDLKRRDLDRLKIMATVVRLLETTLIRVGNDEYEQKNGSFGLTTFHNHHAKVKGAQITFSFKGKSGKRHHIGLEDPQLAKLVRRCQELPGQHLFEFRDATGTLHDVTSEHVNAYLRDIAGEDFSAKDFRTWAGTVQTATLLRELANYASQSEAKRNIVLAIKAVAKSLGNTVAVCRRCYIHPVILTAFLAGRTIAVSHKSTRMTQRLTKRLLPDEANVLKFLCGHSPTSKAKKVA